MTRNLKSMKSRTLEYFISFTIIYKMSYLAAGLTAVGANSATALVLNANARFNQITAGASTTGVRIPSGQPSGTVFEVRNDVANAINVYPPTTGCINALAADAPYVLPSQSYIKFVVGSSIITVVGPPATVVPQVFTFGDCNLKSQVIDTNGVTQTLLASQSGSTVLVRTIAGAPNTITLPAPTTPGMYFRVVLTAVTATPARACTITSVGANTMKGLMIGSPIGGAVGVLAGAASISFAFLSNAAIVGDNAILNSDGTNWNILAVSAAAAGGAFA
jgi:hypothetical protein